MMRIRDIEMLDSSSYIKLIKHIDSDSAYMIREVGEYVKTKEDLVNDINGNTSYWKVVECENTIIAFLKLNSSSKSRLSHKAELSIGIDKAYRNSGIASRLLNDLLLYCKDESIERLDLKVAVKNKSAIALYKKFAFYQTGFYKNDLKLKDGSYLDFIHMSKDLNKEIKKDYSMNLRNMVGTNPLILTGANVIIINSKEEILLHHRRDNDCWGLPGGMMELEETLEENAIREVYEETNLKCRNLELFNIYSGKELYYKYPDGNEVYNVTTTYLCRDYSGDIIVEQTEGKDVKFFSVASIPKNLSLPIKMIIKDYKEQYE